MSSTERQRSEKEGFHEVYFVIKRRVTLQTEPHFFFRILSRERERERNKKIKGKNKGGDEKRKGIFFLALYFSYIRDAFEVRLDNTLKLKSNSE